jgi:phosphinothricin acetyltransferase
MASGPVIRDAVEADIPAIRAIYNQAVFETTAIWNEQTVDDANRIAWWQARRAAGYPVIVASDADRVLGYASFGDFRPFDGYRHTVEHSVYVATDAQGRGIGRALLTTLLDRAGSLGKHVMIGGIEAGNQASLHLHARCGFTEAGRLAQVGRKFDRWLDLVFMHRIV